MGADKDRAATDACASLEGLCGCPIDAAFDVIGRKWSLLIVRNLLRGDRHFTQLLHRVEGLNPKTLSQRLKELELEGLVQKTIVTRNPVKIEYRLTSRGFAILPILRSMARWSFEWAPDRVFDNGKRPAEVEECLEAWQRDLLAEGPEVVVERGSEVLRVTPKPPAKGSTASTAVYP